LSLDGNIKELIMIFEIYMEWKATANKGPTNVIDKKQNVLEAWKPH
jgi:hypothetical protein